MRTVTTINKPFIIYIIPTFNKNLYIPIGTILTIKTNKSLNCTISFKIQLPISSKKNDENINILLSNIRSIDTCSILLLSKFIISIFNLGYDFISLYEKFSIKKKNTFIENIVNFINDIEKNKKTNLKNSIYEQYKNLISFYFNDEYDLWYKPFLYKTIHGEIIPLEELTNITEDNQPIENLFNNFSINLKLFLKIKNNLFEDSDLYSLGILKNSSSNFSENMKTYKEAKKLYIENDNIYNKCNTNNTNNINNVIDTNNINNILNTNPYNFTNINNINNDRLNDIKYLDKMEKIPYVSNGYKKMKIMDTVNDENDLYDNFIHPLILNIEK